jgi:hypothetical protein
MLLTALLLVTAHRLPAPIQEIPESVTPAPKQPVRPKGRALKSETAPSEARSNRPKPTVAQTKSVQFAGTWAGITHTFPWGDISQTITVDATETTMTMVSTNGPDSGKSRTVKAERNGDTLKGNFGNRGVYSLTPLADGATALVRLQAPFNDNTASYHRRTTDSNTTKPSR